MLKVAPDTTVSVAVLRAIKRARSRNTPQLNSMSEPTPKMCEYIVVVMMLNVVEFLNVLKTSYHRKCLH